jgi:hypothetical protein
MRISDMKIAAGKESPTRSGIISFGIKVCDVAIVIVSSGEADYDVLSVALR